jgi:hypothetical protein
MFRAQLLPKNLVGEGGRSKVEDLAPECYKIHQRWEQSRSNRAVICLMHSKQRWNLQQYLGLYKSSGCSSTPSRCQYIVHGGTHMGLFSVL